MFLCFFSCSKKNIDSETVLPVIPIDTTVKKADYQKLARETHGFITSNLLTQYGSYRANTTSKSNIVYEWYVTSQIYADAAMIAAGDSTYFTYMNKTFSWMDNMWDRSNNGNGGYFAACNLDGTGAGGDKYIDDNALTGMVYLSAYDVSSGATKQAYLNRAKACGDWLIKSGLWDNVAEGGFWWSTQKTQKPTQSNGLCLQLFLRLYELTGEVVYKNWALQVDTWLTSKMYDSQSGLFNWMYDGPNASVLHTEKFTYDNAIMVEAYLLYSKILGNSNYLEKAQALGRAMNLTLWNPAAKAYIFLTDPAQSRVNPAWCGWGSQAMIKLYEADKNPAWLTYAQQNIDGLNIACRNTSNNGYHFFASFGGGNRSPEFEGVDQAWMQRVQALMSKYK
ncbi:hypothetical protein GVN22_23850 [Cellulophaga sp. BC115SP]|nr:hypothetical protein [Cellulophaga sp. BC115SP]